MTALPTLANAAAAVAWLRSRGATRLVTDSREVASGDAFIAWPGYAHDARQYVRVALAAGARAAIVEPQGVEHFNLAGLDGVAAWGGACSLKAASGEIASLHAGTPSARLSVIAVTGTNGKTSTAWWTAQALRSLGRRCGVVGTLGTGEPPDAIVASGLTTPDPVALQAAFARFADAGFAACAIEASSIGIVEHRLAGTKIAIAQFTNLTQDHLDYHGTMDAYGAAKAQLFAWPGLEAAVINIDDAHGAALAEALRGGPVQAWTYSDRVTAYAARLRAASVRYDPAGLAFDVIQAGTMQPVRTGLIGEYNVANLLAVIGALLALGVSLADAARACSSLAPVPGRMERVVAEDNTGPEVIVDYAHTPDALDKALAALQPFAAQRGGVLWCVFGCGGSRDALKRPIMGAVAAQRAQRVVVTSDNPRHDDPATIVAQIVSGIDRGEHGAAIESIVDRRAAIAHALRCADAHDVVLIAGKGHEDYQETAGVRTPFSDAAEARAALALRHGTSHAGSRA